MIDAPGELLDARQLSGLIDMGYLQIADGRLALTAAGVPVADAVIRHLLV